MLIGSLVMLILISFSVIAQGGGEGDESLRAELDNLTAYLDEQGYDWLVNLEVFIKLNLVPYMGLKSIKWDTI